MRQSQMEIHAACKRARQHVQMALEALGDAVECLTTAELAVYGHLPVSVLAVGKVREAREAAGNLLDDLIDRDPGDPRERWPDETVEVKRV